MAKIVIKLSLVMAIIVFASAGFADCNKEEYYNTKWCSAHGGENEVRLSNGRADCITSEYVVETDWDNKWKEGIGQSLAYAAAVNKTPAIVLIIQPNRRKDYRAMLHNTIDKMGLGIEVFTVNKC